MEHTNLIRSIRFDADGGAGGGAGDAGSGNEPLKADGTFLAQAPDKYKGDQKYLKDLLPLKSFGGVLDRLYASEGKLAEVQGKLPVVPAKGEEYQLDKPELPEDMEHDPEVEKAFREHALKTGMTQAQAKENYAWFNKLVVDQYKAAAEASKKEKEEGLAKLKQTWGQDYNKKMELMRRAVVTFAGEEFANRLNTVKGPDGILLGNDPVLIEGFYKIGEKIGEDGLSIIGNPGTGGAGGDFLKELYPSMEGMPERNGF